MQFEVIRAEDTLALRSEVLRNGQDVSTCVFPEDNKQSTYHLGAFLNSEIVGVLTLIRQAFESQQDYESYQIRGMAISKLYQKSGIGSQLLDFAISFLHQKNIALVWCNARISAQKFYKKRCFISNGNSFEIPEIGQHIKMYKKLIQ
ncbi:MAG: GNAT family N-acetyltransferase [Bacteroidota bacterium]